MAYDPHAPPPQWGSPPYGQYPPSGPPPYAPPPRDTSGRTVAVIVIAVVGAVVLVPTLIVLLVFVSGYAFRSVAPDPPADGSLGYQRVAADEGGVAFAVPVPDGWRITMRTDDPLLGYRRLGFDGPAARIAVGTFPDPKSRSAAGALDETVRGLKRHGLQPAGAPRTRLVAGEQALMRRLRVRRATDTEVWVAVFVHGGGRWVVLYEGPPSTVEGPYELRATLDQWRW